MTTRILIVEDEAHLAAGIRFNLEAEGYDAEVEADGARALSRLATDPVPAFDLVILDVMLPGVDGFAVADAMRQAGNFTPVLMLTAKSLAEDVVHGLEAGADDYLGKPFALAELRARLTALLRRGGRPLRGELFRRGPVTVDFGRRQAWVGGQEVAITRRELEVLERLAEAGGHAVSRDDLLQDVWGEATRETAASLEVMVARLRRKLERPGGSAIVRTVRGYGYAVVSGEDAQ